MADRSPLLPQDKFDLAAAERIAATPAAVLIPLLPQLLEWLQDPNWPLAAPLAAALRPHQMLFDESTAAVLRGGDEAWKLSLLLYLADRHTAGASLREIHRIADSPTAAEREWGADEAAAAALRRISRPSESAVLHRRNA